MTISGAISGRIHRIHQEPLSLSGSFLDFAGRFAAMPGTVLLMSGGDLDCARYHILAVKPWFCVKSFGRSVVLQQGDGQATFDVSPFQALREILDSCRPEAGASGRGQTVDAGLFGYLAYDLKDFIEDLPRTSVDTLGLPQMCLFAPSLVVVHDKIERTTRISIPVRSDNPSEEIRQVMDWFERRRADTTPRKGVFSGNRTGFRSNFDRSSYIRAVQWIRDYIAAGDVYQVNMSQRFEMGFSGDAFTLFETLYSANPAPFFAYIHAGDHQIVSTSPERFLLQRGRQVETRPIKGTRPRGKTPAEDENLGRELKTSRKDDAELSMIVDLLRNDIGKVCREGTVRVTEHKRLEAYANVFHLVSVVEGELDGHRSSVDLLEASFPGGSITGCPKIRSMEIIDELEPTRRHIYTGSIGYIGFQDTMDLSIAIRTATIAHGRITYSVGGGIVYDSDPASEYEETLHKGETLMNAFSGNAAEEAARAVVWLNGAFTPAEEAALPVGDLGFQYGFGFFETIRVAQGRILRLSEHLHRFEHAWRVLFETAPPDLTWDEIIHQVVCRNDLMGQTAAVKMLATRGDRKGAPHNYGLMVQARPYVHRLEKTGLQGLRLAVYPESRQTPLAAHKTLNYLFYYLAGLWAGKQGADEALILNPDGTVSETNTAGILTIRGRTVTAPSSPFVLPSTMQKTAMDLLKKWGYRLESRQLFRADLLAADEVLLTNALMGAVPVLCIGEHELSPPSGLGEKINRAVL